MLIAVEVPPPASLAPLSRGSCEDEEELMMAPCSGGAMRSLGGVSKPSGTPRFPLHKLEFPMYLRVRLLHAERVAQSMWLPASPARDEADCRMPSLTSAVAAAAKTRLTMRAIANASAPCGGTAAATRQRTPTASTMEMRDGSVRHRGRQLAQRLLSCCR